jgi:hypothetical protein
MKHLSRKYKKRTLRKNRVFGKKNRKTVVKKRNYKKRNTRKRRRVGGMFEEDEDRDADVEVGFINDQSINDQSINEQTIIQSKSIVPFIDTKDPSIMESGILKPVITPISKSKSTTPTLRGPTPSVDPNMSLWQGATGISEENLKRYNQRGDYSKPPLTDQEEDRQLLLAYYPKIFDESDDDYQTPRSSISSGTYGTPPTGREKIIPDLNINTSRSNRTSDPILDIFQFKSPEEREMIARALERTNTFSNDDGEDYYSKKSVEKRRKEKEENLKALRKEYGIDSD